MQKKVLLAAMLALFVCGGAFAQEAEAPEAGMPETEVPAAESSSSGGRPAFLDTMYAGLDLGLGTYEELIGDAPKPTGFLLSPKIGIAPIAKLPRLAFQFGLDMVFGTVIGGRSRGSGSSGNVTAEHKTNVFLPYIGATWTFTDWMIQPYAGLGFGIAFANNESYKKEIRAGYTVSFDQKTKPAFATKLIVGGKYTIPNTKFALNAEIALALLNPEVETTITDTYYGIKGDPDKYAEQSFYTLFNFVLGAVYHF